MQQPGEHSYSIKPVSALGVRRKGAIQRGIFNFLLPRLPDSAAVLEIGPGHGEVARECRSRGLSYLGIEPSKELWSLLAQAQFEVVNETVPPIPIDDARFDLLHSNGFVEHVSDYREVMQFFLDAHRVLKSGGYISVIAPNYLTTRHLFFQYEYQHSYVTTLCRLRNMLTDCGFPIVTARCFLLSLSPRLRWLDPVLAPTLIPVALNPLIQGLASSLASQEFLFRVNKNMFDHVAILARKPV
jgi:SAM-dependent methyltransferase